MSIQFIITLLIIIVLCLYVVYVLIQSERLVKNISKIISNRLQQRKKKDTKIIIYQANIPSGRCEQANVFLFNLANLLRVDTPERFRKSDTFSKLTLVNVDELKKSSNISFTKRQLYKIFGTNNECEFYGYELLWMIEDNISPKRLLKITTINMIPIENLSEEYLVDYFTKLELHELVAIYIYLLQ